MSTIRVALQISGVLMLTIWLSDYRFISIDIATRRLIESYGLRISKNPDDNISHQLRRLGTPEHHGHTKAWMVLEEVDGLKNEDVVFFVQTTTTSSEETSAWSRIIPEARTWMRLIANVYVVAQDHTALRYNMRHCQNTEFRQNTVFTCHNEPKYLLTRTSHQTNEAFQFLLNDDPELFNHVKYIIYCEDSVFWRADQFLKWLAAIENSGLNNFPIVANYRPSPNEHVKYRKKHKKEDINTKLPFTTNGASHAKILDLIIKENSEISQVNCENMYSAGSYTPLVMNKNAAVKLKEIINNGYIHSQGKVFGHDWHTAFGVVVWMLGFYHTVIPAFIHVEHGQTSGGRLTPSGLAIDSVQDDRSCTEKQYMQWPFELRFNQDTAVGCGDIDHPQPLHEQTKNMLTMYDCWEFYRDHGEPLDFSVGKNLFKDAKVIVDSKTNLIVEIVGFVEEGQPDIEEPKLSVNQKVETRVIPYLHLLSGYEKTKHAKGKKIDNLQPMTEEDCN